MHLNISMENFRCFGRFGPVRVAPITILIGENSAGKTSFLAGLREIVEMFNQPTGTLFNREPFFLGSFEQIAHYRGGRSGRAKSFGFEVDILPNSEVPDLFTHPHRSPRSAVHKLLFTKGEIQPELVRYEVSVKDISAIFDLSGERSKISIHELDKETVTLDSKHLPSAFLIRREIAFFGYYLNDLAHRVSVSGKKDSDKLADSTIRSLGAALRSSSNTMRRSVFASAPVRYQPRRVYTPSELTSQNAGEQVPLEMANLKLSAPDKWEVTKQRLNAFGKKSGLFDDIDIKRFGKTTSDPFQIQVKNSGPASNIVDVGYGVSQALPLLFPLQEEKGFDFFLLQQPEVHLHPRAQAEFGTLVAFLSKDHPRTNYVIETHSDYVLDRIRSEVRSGTVLPSNVSILLFKRDGVEVSVLQMGLDNNGEVIGYPEDYRSFFLEEQARVLGL